MTAQRAYHARRSVQEAIGEMRRCAGKQFDPLVVEALVALWECGELELEASLEQAPAGEPVALGVEAAGGGG